MKKYSGIAALFLTGAIIFSFQHTVQAEKPDQEKSLEEHSSQEYKDLNDRFSYSYGALLAKDLMREEVEMNVDLMAKAMRAVYNGEQINMSHDELVATNQLFRELHAKKREKKLAAEGVINKKEGEAFLSDNAKKEGVVVTESGLQYKIVREGIGGYKPAPADIITVHYRGTTIDGKQFDDSPEEGFTARLDGLIPGWIEAIQLMTTGAKLELFIPAGLAYGEEGKEGFVGRHAAVIFEVELLSLEKAEDV